MTMEVALPKIPHIGLARRALEVAFAAGMLLVATSVQASGAPPERLRFLVCQPGGPELGAEEQTVIRDLYRYVEKKLEMKEGAIEGSYYNKRKDCLKALGTDPDLLMLSLDLFIERRKDMKLQAVAQIELHGSTEHRYYLMASARGPKSLNDLRGKPIAGTHLDNAKFVARVILGGRLGTPAELVLQPKALGLRAVRSVIRGKADAVLLVGAQYRALRGTPFEKKLKLVHESDPLPNAPVAVTAKRVPADLRARLGKILDEMASDPKGRALVDTFGIGGFARPAPNTWDRIDATMRRP